MAASKFQLQDVKDAAERIRGKVKETPLEIARSQLLPGVNIYLKKDCLMEGVGSFKARGACNMLMQLTEEQKQRGVITASAGNHAVALAYYGMKLGVPVTVVLPTSAPQVKVEQCKACNPKMIKHGKDLVEAKVLAIKKAEEEGLQYVNGYNDLSILAGQGIAALEVLEQMDNLGVEPDAIVIPVGGGGLLAGMVTVIQHFKPNMEIIAVESEWCQSFTEAIKNGKPVKVDSNPATLADNLNVSMVGGNSFEIVRRYTNNFEKLQMEVVEEEHIKEGILMLEEKEGIVVEGGGAITLAACLYNLRSQLQGKNVVLMLTGGNIDPDKLRSLRFLGTRQSYCAHLYHTMENVNEWIFYFVITQDLDAENMVVREHYGDFAKDATLWVIFTDSEITLNIPDGGLVTGDGWRITPFYHPTISRKDADQFKMGQWIPQCQLIVQWEKEGQRPVTLRHKVDLIGAKAPNNFINLIVDPAGEADFQLENLMIKYRNQEKIKHRSLKCLFTGPPRVGKTTLKKRLLKVITNLISSGEVSPSGGLEKPISVVIGETRECVTIVMRLGTDWQPQHDLLDEAQLVVGFIDQQPTTQHPSPPKPSPPTLHPTSLKPGPPTPGPPTPGPPTPGPPTPGPPTPDSPINDPDPPTPDADTYDGVRQLIKEVLAKRGLRTIKDIEKTTTLYFMDTGGQPEFHEIMPIILNGPALHLVFFNLTIDFSDPISIRFCHQDGTNAEVTYNSSYTGKQMIYQLLSSLYYMSPHSEPATVQGLSPHSQSESAAVLIGTHLDQLEDQGKKIEKINDFLQKLFSNVEFHDQAFLTYPTKDKSTIFTPVNNYSGDEEEIHQLQAFLTQVIHDRFHPVELPSSWLLFHLLLRHHYENSPGVCTLAECRPLAKGCGLDEDDVPQVLRYIHRHLGTILFYDQVQGLNELVICDPNVLFRSIYQLVAVSFGGDRSYHTPAAKIRKTGEIPSKVLEQISNQPTGSLLTNEHIIELLKHFKILTEFVSDDRTVYFMPCLLQPNHSLEISKEALQALCQPPLLVCFDGNYIPVGVFSALVVKLSQSSWKPDQATRYRNQLLFHTDGVFPVELIVHPAYLEFRIRIANYKEEELKEIHQFCVEVRKTVVDSLKSILGLHEHTKTAKFQLGFYCPGSFQADGQPHFCGCLPCLNYTHPKSYVCSESPQCQNQCRLPQECTIWFEYWKDKKTSENTGTLGEDSLTTILDSISTLAAEWFNLGVALGLSYGTLREIEKNHSQDVRRCLTEMVMAWLQMKDNAQPSWQSLVFALNSPSVNRTEIANVIAKMRPS